jgi:RNA polymerase sigma factor (sigma-70 family)
MARGQLEPVLRHLRGVFAALDAERLNDAELLHRFVDGRDDAAFTALVRRHGGLVLKVCRNVLRREADAEDAFQATFLVLARKAASVRHEPFLGGWLHTIAFRCARDMRKSAMRRQIRETTSRQPHSEESPVASAAMNELQAILDEEIQRLSVQYRNAFVLCVLQGKSRAEATAALACTEGTLASRLARAREMLQKRLTARGIALSAALCACAVSSSGASASVSATLANSATVAALAFTSGQAVGGTSVHALALANGVLKGMLVSKVSFNAIWMTVVCLGIAGVGSLIAQTDATTRKDAPLKPSSQAALVDREAKAEPSGRQDDSKPLPRGAHVRFGASAFRTGEVRISAMARDGQTLYVRSESGIHLIDLKTGLSVRHYPDTYLRSKVVEAFAVSPNGELLAAGNKKGTFLWDLKSGQSLRPLAARSLDGATFSPDGNKLVVRNDDPSKIGGAARRNGVRVIDVGSGQEDYRLVPDQEDISQILFTPDGRTLITVGDREKPSIYVTDMRSKKQIHSLHADKSQSPLVALSRDGKTLVVTDQREAAPRKPPIRTMRFVDLASGQYRNIDQNELSKNYLYRTLFYSPDDRFLIVVLSDSCLVLDVVSGKVVQRIPLGGARAHFTPDGRHLVFLNERTIRVWDFVAARELHPPEQPMAVANNIAFSPDGATLASWSDNSPIQFWNAATGRLTGSLETHDRSRTGRDVVFGADGRLVTSNRDGVIRIWDAATLQPIAKFDVPGPGGRTIGVACDGRTLVAVSFPPLQAPNFDPKGRVRLERKATLHAWDLIDRQIVRQSELATTDRYLYSLTRFNFQNRDMPSLSPDGRTYLGRSAAGVFLKDTLTDAELVQLKLNPHPAGAEFLALDLLEGPVRLSTDGQTAAVIVPRLRETKSDVQKVDSQVVVFNLTTWSEQCRIPIGNAYAPTFALAPEGGRVASIADLAVQVWDTTTGKMIWESPQVDVDILSLAFSPDGNHLATSLNDTTILTWDVSSSNRQEKKKR